MPKKPTQLADFIVPLNMNGLEGRMLRMPARSKRAKRDILLVYGHHAMLERWFALVENLLPYGSVTMPDLPGFGGMDSFYKIGKQPTIDNFADYLASFIKLRYKTGKITIVGISFGFAVATRMLQRYPELSKKVEVVVSIVGFMHRDDFVFKPRNRKFYSRATRVLSNRVLAWIVRYGFLNRFAIHAMYKLLPLGKSRLLEADDVGFVNRLMEYETRLWQANDLRTHWATTSEFLQIDNCRVGINLPIWHVASKNDHYFNNQIVKEHMLVVFAAYNEALMHSKAHTPHVMSDAKETAVMLPPALRKMLSQRPQ